MISEPPRRPPQSPAEGGGRASLIGPPCPRPRAPAEEMRRRAPASVHGLSDATAGPAARKAVALRRAPTAASSGGSAPSLGVPGGHTVSSTGAPGAATPGLPSCGTRASFLFWLLDSPATNDLLNWTCDTAARVKQSDGVSRVGNSGVGGARVDRSQGTTYVLYCAFRHPTRSDVWDRRGRLSRLHGGIVASGWRARGPVPPHGGGPGQTTDGVKGEWGPDFLDGGCPVPIGGPVRHVPAAAPPAPCPESRRGRQPRQPPRRPAPSDSE